LIDDGTVRQIVEAKLRPWIDRLRGMVVRGAVKVLDEAGGLQRAQVTLGADDIAEDVEVLTPPGFTSRPAQAEALVFAVQGAPGHRVALLFDRTTRLKGELQDGEAALYVGRAGQLVKLRADGGVEVRAAGDAADASVVLTAAGDVVVTPAAAGKVLLGGAAAAKKVALADDVDARFAAVQTKFDTHVHGGVTVGPGSTAVTPTLIGPLAPTGADNVYGKG
jgi:phage gp45-like